MKRALREGFTTGTAAAAAAQAAVTLLLGCQLPGRVSPLLPPFVRTDGGYVSENTSQVVVPIAFGGRCPLPGEATGAAWAGVIKDGGDDPDATHKALILVHAARLPFGAPVAWEHPHDSELAHPDMRQGGYASTPLHIDGLGRELYLAGGVGVGVATLPGLPMPPGEPAINPEPRKQIALAADAAARACGYSGPLHLLVSVPEGQAIARRTMNARLGIKGGISILGTRGTVRPYSHEAWKATIAQGLRVAVALGLDTVLFSTGRRSERMGFGLYPALPEQAGVQVADYAAFAMREAAALPLQRIVWCCFPGKLLKLAQGLEWTHAKGGDADIPLLARLWEEQGGARALAPELAALPTAAGAFARMQQADAGCAERVLGTLGQRAHASLLGWLQEERARQGICTKLPEVALRVFTQQADGEYALALQL